MRNPCVCFFPFLLVVFPYTLFGPGQAASGAQDAPNQSIPRASLTTPCERCVETCLRDHQQLATDRETITADCRLQCRLSQARQFLQAGKPERQIRGVEILAGCRGEESVDLLIKALEREFHDRTGLSAWIIPALGDQGDPRAVPVLVKALNLMDESWFGREKAARALGLIGDPGAIPALIKASQRMETRLAALRALARFRDPRVAAPLISALGPEEESEIRDVAMAGLRNLGNTAIPELVAAFGQFNPEYPETEKRVALCRLLGQSSHRQALAALRGALQDPDPAVRACAAQFIHQ